MEDLRQKSHDAKRKLDNEEREIREREESIRKKKEDLKKITDVSTMIERKVSAMLKYEEFLDKVKTQYSDEFSEMTDILNRYDTLKRANKELVEQNQSLQEELDKLTEEVSIYEREKGNEILRMNNNIAELQKTLEKSEDERNRKQRTVEDAIKGNRVQSKQLSKLLMAVNNLYWMCKKRRLAIGLKFDEDGEDTTPFGTTKEAIVKAMSQLDIVKQFMKSCDVIFSRAPNMGKTHQDGKSDTKKNLTKTNTGIATHH